MTKQAMDKYRRVEKDRKDDEAHSGPPAEPNEVRITQKGPVRGFISYAHGLLTEKQEPSVVLKAMGNAISKAVTVAEVLKHRVVGLHQLTRISSIETVDVYEPLEEGLDRIEQQRLIPSITIHLSLAPLDVNDPGYQAPIPASLVSPQVDDKLLPSHAGKRPAKKQREKKPQAAEKEKENEADARVEGQQESVENGSGRKKSGRGRGRGGNVGTRTGSAEGKENSDAAANNKASDAASPEEKDAAPRKPRAPRKKKEPVAGGDDAAAKVDGSATAEPASKAEGEAEGAKGKGGRGNRSSRGRGGGRGGRGETKAETAVVASE